MQHYEITTNDIIEIYEANLEHGADHIRLYYDDVKEELIIGVRCTDDAYPYWIKTEPMKCSLMNWSIILYYIVNGRLCDERTGNNYPVSLEWLWYNRP